MGYRDTFYHQWRGNREEDLRVQFSDTLKEPVLPEQQAPPTTPTDVLFRFGRFIGMVVVEPALPLRTDITHPPFTRDEAHQSMQASGEPVEIPDFTVLDIHEPQQADIPPQRDPFAGNHDA